MKISTGNSRMEKHWNLEDVTLEAFRDRISKTIRTAETVEQYKKLSKAAFEHQCRYLRHRQTFE